MSITLIIIIGILILASFTLWSTKVESKSPEFEANKEIAPTDFEQNFETIEFKGGTLRFWGNWFGRPLDNYHEIKSTEFDKELNILLLIFNEGERLKIWKPSNIEIGNKELRIKKADRILFEWHLYGENATDENLRFEEYSNNGISINFKTDFMPEKRNTECYKSDPALSIIGY